MFVSRLDHCNILTPDLQATLSFYTELLEMKAHFSKYLEKVASGEIIVLCKHNKPFVEISPIHKVKPAKRILGSAKSSLAVASDCFEPWPKEMIGHFYGEGKSSKSDPLFWKP